YPGGALQSGGAVAEDGGTRETIDLPFIDDASAATPAQAAWTIRHSLAPLHAIRRGMDRWLLAAVVAAIVLAAVIARLSAARVNRPLEELASRSRRIDLERLDVSFATQRYDEIGSLSRVLDGMVRRLRASAAELRRAERRATVGDMARQVNHDIRNGLLPIRNVIRHLGEVARDAPAELAAVFTERADTLHGGIGYLENLATNYARLSPGGERQSCDVNAAIREAVSADHASAPAGGTPVRLELMDAPLVVMADPVALRRIIENLVVNATDSLENGSGSVVVGTRSEEHEGGRRVVISVADTGSGIDADALERVFDDFYTTKRHGSGLGLSIVRRLVTDMGGRIRVDSRVGGGTTFRIELPEAE
ncbi:MAG: ATP-binding protein, partial [Longimicrobiales bacterium]